MVIRELIVHRVEDSASRTIEHVHFSGWHDLDCPDEDKEEHLIKLVMDNAKFVLK